uniref:Uncharacterized protein n=1 Tax=Opuntia streptacantha TaxID=393608 RepID=A0A7C8ZMW8_OPUST
MNRWFSQRSGIRVPPSGITTRLQVLPIPVLPCRRFRSTMCLQGDRVGVRTRCLMPICSLCLLQFRFPGTMFSNTGRFLRRVRFRFPLGSQVQDRCTAEDRWSDQWERLIRMRSKCKGIWLPGRDQEVSLFTMG